MAKVKTFTRSNCGEVRAEMEKAFEKVAKKFDLNLSFGKGRFSTNEFSLKLTLNTRSKSGEMHNQIENDFIVNAVMYGLQASDLGRSFRSGGSQFTIIGAKPRNFKYPIIARGVRGGRYKFPADAVKNFE